MNYEVIFDDRSWRWVASGKGYLRPIVSEAISEINAILGYKAMYERQQGEEYEFVESMSHLTDCAMGQPYGEDLG